MTLKPVRRPRAWGAASLALLAIVTGVLVWAEAFEPEPPRENAVIWGLGVPASLAFCWTVSVWRRAYDRARRLARGLCADCGYDCRATPGRCPECGATVEAAPPAPPAASRQ